MDINKSAELFDEYEITLIRVKSKSVIGKAGLRPEDIEDVMQDIILDILLRLPNFDPEKSSRHTFIDDLANNRIARMLCDRSCSKRNYKLEPASLDTIADNAQAGDAVSEEAAPWNSGERTLSDFEVFELREDIVRVLEKLPPKMRGICVMLMQNNICAVAAETGIPKATLIAHLKKIRNHFENSGMENYF
jgi:RNA polymerase sigma-70 factor (ECF subfamily)